MEYTKSSRSMSFPELLIWISFSEVSGTRLAQTRISTIPPLARVLTRNMFVHHFRHIEDAHFSFKTSDFDRVFDIDHTERAGCDDNVGAGLGSHLHPQHTHPLILFRLVEQHESAAATAEGAITAPAHL